MNAVSPEVQSHQAIRAKPLAVTFVDHLAGLDAMRDAWTSLIEAQSADEPLFFQSFEWCRHIAGVRHGPKSWRLAVAFVRSGDDLVGIWPLSVQLRAGARQVRSLDDPFGQFASIICAPELTHQCVLAILNGLRSAGIGDLITIEKVISGSQLDRALKAQGSRASLSGHSVVLNAGAFVDYADYHAKLNRKTAKNLRNAMNRLTRLGEVRSEVVTDPFEVANLIQSTFDGRLAWMKAYGKTAPAFREPDYEEIINSLGISAKEIGLIGFTLTSAGTKIAEQWGFIHRNTYYAYISVTRPGHARTQRRAPAFGTGDQGLFRNERSAPRTNVAGERLQAFVVARHEAD